MPSGAKKRKAAKKKKGFEVKGDLPYASAVLHTHGEEDSKNRDEKDSDEGEVSSPASQDSRNQHQFVEGEADKQEESEGEKMEKKVTVEEESVIRVERELKVSNEPQDKNVPIKDNDNMTSYTIQPEVMKNEKKKLGVDDESASLSEDFADMGSRRKENEAVQTSHDSVAETQENGVKQPLLDDSRKVEISTGDHPVKDYEVPECSENQPLLGSSLQPVQTTSWKSCCGLFELFTGSSR